MEEVMEIIFLSLMISEFVHVYDCFCCVDLSCEDLKLIFHIRLLVLYLGESVDSLCLESAQVWPSVYLMHSSHASASSILLNLIQRRWKLASVSWIYYRMCYLEQRAQQMNKLLWLCIRYGEL